MKKQHVILTIKDLEDLKKMLQKGSLKSRTYKRVVALLELHKGATYKSVSKIVLLTTKTLKKLTTKYAKEGLLCLLDLPRSGRPIETGQDLKDRIIKLACEEPPTGYSQWSIRLLADRVVELEYCDKISHTQVFKILKKKNKTAPR